MINNTKALKKKNGKAQRWGAQNCEIRPEPFSLRVNNSWQMALTFDSADDDLIALFSPWKQENYSVALNVQVESTHKLYLT